MSLFGLPGAEAMDFTVEEAFDNQVAWWLCEEDLSDPPIVTIEEWSELPPIHHVPSAERILEWISETIADEGELTGDGAEAFDRALRDTAPTVENVRHLIANKVTWRQADQLVARWTVTLGATGEPEFHRTPIEESER